jgi:tRNA nucleotidyltransferase (CCA-adding enzyme)
VDALVPERVWQELARGLMEEHPSRVFDVLRECGALERIAPQLAAVFEDDALRQETADALDELAGSGATLDARFAVLARTLDPYAIEALGARLKLPSSVRELALLTSRHSHAIADAHALEVEAILELMNAADAWRRPERYDELLQAALAGEPDRGRAKARLDRALKAAAAVDAGAIAKASGKPEEIREKLFAARLNAIRTALPQ